MTTTIKCNTLARLDTATATVTTKSILNDGANESAMTTSNSTSSTPSSPTSSSPHSPLYSKLSIPPHSNATYTTHVHSLTAPPTTSSSFTVTPTELDSRPLTIPYETFHRDVFFDEGAVDRDRGLEGCWRRFEDVRKIHDVEIGGGSGSGKEDVANRNGLGWEFWC